MANHLRLLQPITTLPFETNLKSSNSEFLEWWLDGTILGSDNEHWQTYRNLINPCLYKWDYILKLENIEEESKWLFAEFNITDIGYPPGNTHPTIAQLFRSFSILQKLTEVEIIFIIEFVF